MKRLFAVTVAVAVSLPLLTAVTAQATGASTLTWKACADKPEVECATLRVPLDWAKPGGEKITLSLARRKGAGKNLPTLLYGVGGPGGASAGSLKQSRYFSDGVYQKYNVVAHDPRGIGESKPVMCPDGATDEFIEMTTLWPSTAAEFARKADFFAKHSAGCREISGPIHDHVDTLSDAMDMEAIRVALGEKKLNYFGSSYGTLRGQQYAEKFPSRVGRLVLDSTMDHSLGSAWEFLRTQAVVREERFTQFVTWCQDNKDCVLHGQDVIGLTAELHAKAARGELRDPQDPATVVSGHTFSDSLAGYVMAGMWANTAEYLRSLSTGAPGTLAAPPPTSGYSAGAMPRQAIWCADWNNRIADFDELRRLEQRLAQVAPNVRYFPADAGVSCIGWAGEHRNPHHEIKLPGSVQGLIANSRYDRATVYPWAHSLAEQTGLRLLTYDGKDHITYDASACMRDRIDKYLLDGTLPAPGTHCPDEGAA